VVAPAGQIARVELKEPFAGLFLCVGSNKGSLVGEAGYYLNRPGELRGGVLELIRAHRDRLEQCVPLVDALGTVLVTPPAQVRETIDGLRFAGWPGSSFLP
jgi:hypothetical protein